MATKVPGFRRIFDSIVTRLLLLALCLVVFGTVVRYYALTGFLQKDLSAVVESQQLALANYVASDVDDKIAQRQSVLERLAAALPAALLDQPDELRDWLKRQYEFQPLYSVGLFVLNAGGSPIAEYPVLQDRANLKYTDRDYFQAGLAGKSFVGRPVIGRAAKEPVLPFSAPVRNAKNEVIAVLVGVAALADPGFLSSLLQGRIGGTTGGFLLISPQDRLFVASSQPEMVLQSTPPPGVNALHDRSMAGYRGTGITVNARGIEEVSAIASVPSTGWFVVARLPTSEAFATVARMQDFLIMGAVLTILVFAVVATTGLYLNFRHLFRAAAHADRMTMGELPLEPLPVTRNDEVGHLIAAFNRLLLKLKDNQADLQRMAHHDMLTGLPNRTLLYDRLHQMLAQARRKKSSVALLFMDLDGFKHINDTHGHEAGDDALRQIGGRFSGIVRAADTLARVGGDEFVIVLSDLAGDGEKAAATVAAKCVDALKAPLAIAGATCTVGISIGIALGDGNCTADDLLLRADQAMYEAKKSGRGRYVIHGLPDLHKTSA